MGTNITAIDPPLLGDTGYVQKIIDSFNGVDAHDHSSGKGLPVERLGTGSVDNATLEINANKARIKDGGVTPAKLSGTVAVVPTGAILPFGGTSAPTGFLLCNGSAVSRTTFSVLFSTVSTAFGNGDGSTTFNLPDLRGRFLRGVDSGANNDPDAGSRTGTSGGNAGDAVGSLQGHSFQTHTHTQASHNHFVTDPGHMHRTTAGQSNQAPDPAGAFSSPGGGTFFGTAETAGTGISLAATTAVNNNAVATGGTAQATANETRPVNITVNYIIKT